MACRLAEALIATAWDSLPRVTKSAGDFDDWDTCGRGLIARTAYLLESVLVLRDRPMDAEVIARSLFDHTVVFCWLAIDPQNNMKRWMAHDFKERLAMADHASKFGLRRLPPQHEEYFKDQAGKVKKLPTTVDMARAADAHWLSVFNGIFTGVSSLEGGYAVMFRGYSAAVHPTSRGISHFLSGRSGQVAVGRPVVSGTPIASSASAMTAMLLVCSRVFHWYDANAIARLWRQYPIGEARLGDQTSTSGA
ncbi:MAG: DUF5677 domain-containing protein [Polyangiaceae bacterium]